MKEHNEVYAQGRSETLSEEQGNRARRADSRPKKEPEPGQEFSPGVEQEGAAAGGQATSAGKAAAGGEEEEDMQQAALEESAGRRAEGDAD